MRPPHPCIQDVPVYDIVLIIFSVVGGFSSLTGVVTGTVVGVLVLIAALLLLVVTAALVSCSRRRKGK